MQVIFIYSATGYPDCSLDGNHCRSGEAGDPPPADAYVSEGYLANILRYLQCCKLDANGQSTGQPRYPTLKQVFLISRNYGGYAINDPGNDTSTQGCLSPEPFAYELAFGIQRLIPTMHANL